MKIKSTNVNPEFRMAATVVSNATCISSKMFVSFENECITVTYITRNIVNTVARIIDNL